MTAIANASVAYADGVASADEVLAQASSSAQRTFELDRATELTTATSATSTATIASAANAKTVGIDKAKAEAKARNKYEKAVAAAQNTFADVEQNERETLDDELQSAWWIRAAGFSAAASAALSPLTAAAANGIYESAQTAWVNSVADAEKAHADARIDARKVLIEDVADAERSALQELGIANLTFTTATGSEALASATTSENNEHTRVKNVAEDERIRAKAVADAQKTHRETVATREQTQAIAIATAEATYEVDVASANLTWEIAKLTQFAADVSAWATSQGTQTATYLAAETEAVKDYAISTEIVENQLVASQTTADIAMATGVANAQKAYTDSLAAAAKTHEDSRADATEKFTVAESKAQRDFRVTSVEKSGNRNVAEVTAKKNFNDSMANAQHAHTYATAGNNHTWAKKESQSAADEFRILNNPVGSSGSSSDSMGGLDPLDESYMYEDPYSGLEDIEVARKEAEDERSRANLSAEATKVQAEGNAELKWMQDLTASDVSYASAIGTARNSLATAVRLAQVTAATDKKTAANAAATSIGTAMETYGNAVQSSTESWINAYGAADVAYVTAVNPHDVSYATDLGTAEAAYLTDTAVASATDTYGADSVTVAAAQAKADWLTNTSSAYVTFSAAVTTAAGNHSLSVTTAEAARADAEAAADTIHVQAIEAAAKATFVAEVTAAQDAIYSEIQRTGDHAVSIMNATVTQTNSLEAARKIYADSATAATVGKEYAYARAQADHYDDASARQSAMETANATHELAVALTNEQFRKKQADIHRDVTVAVTNAKDAYTSSIATDANTRASNLNTATRNYSAAVATADKVADKSYADAKAQFWKDEAQADKQDAIDVVTAQMPFLAAQYTERAAALSTMATTAPTPWTHFASDLADAESAWVTTRGPQYVAYVTNVAEADRVYASALADVYQTRAHAEAGARETHGIGMADATRISNQARDDAEKTYILTVSGEVKKQETADADALKKFQREIATEKRKLALGGSQSAYDSKFASAVETMEEEKEDAADTLQEATAKTQGDLVEARANSDRDFAISEANETRDRAKSFADALEAARESAANKEFDHAATVIPLTAADWMASTAGYAAAMTAGSVATGTTMMSKQALLANAYATYVATVAPAQSVREVAKADATRNRDIAIATVDKDRDHANADSARTTAVNAASETHGKAVADANALRDQETPPHGQHENWPALARPQTIVVSMIHTTPDTELVVAEGTRPIVLILNSRFDQQPETWHDTYRWVENVGQLYGVHGDMYFSSIATQMFMSPADIKLKEVQALGYSSQFSMALGERVRGLVGDEVLTSAEDWQLIGAVVAISTVAAVAIVATGGAIMQVGAAAGGALAGAVGAILSGLVAAGTTAFVTGALGSAAFSASSQFILTGEVNLLQVATDGLQGGAMALLFVGAAGSLGAAGKWLNKLRNVGDEACNIGTFIATWSMRAYATHGVYSSYQAAQQGDLEAAMSGVLSRWGNGGSPILYGDLLIVFHGPGTPSVLYGLNRKTGETVWTSKETPINSPIFGSWSTPVIVKAGGHDELIMPLPGDKIRGAGYFKGYSPATGKSLWQIDGLGNEVYAMPIIGTGGDIIVGVSGHNGPTMAIRPGGSGNATSSHRLWQTTTKNPQRVGSGIIHNGNLFLADATGILQCLKADTGEPVFRKRLGGNLWGSILLAEDRLYVSSLEGDTFVVQASGDFEVLAKNSTGEPTYAALAPSNGEFFLRTHKNLYCIGKP